MVMATPAGDVTVASDPGQQWFSTMVAFASRGLETLPTADQKPSSEESPVVAREGWDKLYRVHTTTGTIVL